jgi:hypothetical protein
MTEEMVQYQTTRDTAIEAVIAKGDLAKLTPAERVNYYRAVCKSIGVNELTQPFQYILLNNKLTLYATRTCADQLRQVRGVSIAKPDIQYVDDLVVVSVSAVDRDGRTDSDLGVVAIGALKGVDRANGIMKAITKAKRRVTLSLCGLGWLDETEVETIPDARRTVVNTETGEIASNGTETLVKPSLARAKAVFIADVLKTIPYYQHENHVANTLKQLGFTGYTVDAEPHLLEALQEHANARADEAAANETVVLNDLVSNKPFEEA